MKAAACLAATALCCALAQAKVVTQTVAYSYNGKPMKGYVAWDDAKSGPRPGVLVIHEWWGLNDYIRGRARQMAEMGYVAFAPDMYGEGKVTADPKEAEKMSSAVFKELGPRAQAGLEALRKQKGVDAKRIGAMGFCFGGSSVLALAYTGADLKGAVTFHGGLFPPQPGQAAKIRAPILILHGDSDTFTEPKDVAATKKALDEGKVDWLMVSYARAVHGFTNPDAGKFNIPGLAYDEKAATRSWDEMRRFFETALK